MLASTSYRLAPPQRAAQPHRSRPRVFHRRHVPPSARAQGAGDPDELGPSSGDREVQELLVRELEFEIGKKQVEADVEAGKEKLRQVAEEGKRALDELAEIKRFQADLTFESTLEEMNQEVEAVEEDLRLFKERMEASNAEFEAWQDDMAVRRSEGQFFQSLYQRDAKRPTGPTAEQLKAQRDRITAPAAKEVGSRLRALLFSFLALALAGSALGDLATRGGGAVGTAAGGAAGGTAVPPWQDVLYLGLAALLGVTAVAERGVFRRKEEEGEE